MFILGDIFFKVELPFNIEYGMCYSLGDNHDNDY